MSIFNYKRNLQFNILLIKGLQKIKVLSNFCLSPPLVQAFMLLIYNHSYLQLLIYIHISFQMNSLVFFTIFSILSLCSAQTKILVADFLKQPTYTGFTAWNNYVGIVMNLEEIQPYYNHTLLQGYIINSNLKNNWDNNFLPIIRSPKGHFYNCSIAPTTNCTRQYQNNQTFFSQYGQFIWNTASQPNWVMGLNNEHLNLSLSTTRNVLKNYFMKVYYATYRVRYFVEMMYQGDKAVQNGMRLGNFTPQDFLSQSAQYEEILFGLGYRAPGLSQQANADWIATINEYGNNVWIGFFSYQPIIFLNESLATIDNLLDDNYTKGYLERRAKITPEISLSSFNFAATLNRIRLVKGEGIDGITNTFAAAIWWIDFLMESVFYEFFDVSIEGAIRDGNFQSLLGPPPTFTPTSLYYASLFFILATEKYPSIVLPSIIQTISPKIKVYGLESSYIVKYLIINKDKDPSLNGKVDIMARGDVSSKLTCIYLEASSLTSKGNDIKIGGHSFIGGNFTVQGRYQKHIIGYNTETQSYSVSLKYAQVVLCQTQNPNIVIPTKSECESREERMNYIGLFAILITLLIFK